MTIWLLSLLLLASLAGLGYRQGAVRVAFSLFGILFGALLAVPLGHLTKPVFSAVGMKSPLLLWMVPPFVMFALVLTLFKIAGLAAHRKTEVYYKYKAGDLRLALWERLNRRVGLSLGLVNGLAYLVLLSFVIYAFSYWTVQVSGAEESRGIKTLNALGKDLEATGMIKAAGAVDRLPASYYDAADALGTVYHNYSPQLQTRVSCYPAFLAVGERPEFQDLIDPDFLALWRKPGSLSEFAKHPKVAAILHNPELLKVFWAAAQPNLQDFDAFLKSGESEKYGSEKIVGRWTFDINGAIALFLKAKPGTTATQKAAMRRTLEATLKGASLVATPDGEVFLKHVLAAKPAPGATFQTYQGEWKSSGSRYEVTLKTDTRSEPLTVEIQNDRMAIPASGMAFVREN